MKPLFTLVFVVMAIQSMFGQGNTVFGLQYRPIIPNELFNGESFEMSNEEVEASVSNKFSHTFGMVIRHNFTEHWSLETGINQLRRNLWIDALHYASEKTSRFDLGMLTYEIPVQGLYYVQLGSEFYMNASAGLSVNFYPSEHSKVSPGEGVFRAQSARKSWTGLSVLANVGWEYRTDDAGYFYIGASLHRPVNNVSQIQVAYRLNGQPYLEAFEWYAGNFMCLDLRYFFPADSKTTEPRR